MISRLALAALVLSVVPAGAHTGSHQVSVRDNYYEPRELHVDPGETVTWTWDGANNHTVTADDGSFDVLVDRDHRIAQRVFSVIGRFPYHCRVHGSAMSGVIVIGPVASAVGRTWSEGDVGSSTVRVAVRLDRPSDDDVDVIVSTEDGTATAPVDYGSVSQSLHFASGELEHDIEVVVQGDESDEVDETFRVLIESASNANAGGAATVTILDDDGPPTVRRVPSSTYPTIESALVALGPGNIVEIEPGAYPIRATLTITTSDVTLRGMGATPDDVVIAPSSIRPAGTPPIAIGLRVAADNVRLENLSVKGFARTGLSIESARGFVVDRVRAASNSKYGIRTDGSRRGVIQGSLASGSSSAGIAVEHCGACDVIVRDSGAETNLVGFLATDAGSLVVRDSEFRKNNSGIILRTVLPADSIPQQGSHIYGNVVSENADPSAPVPAPARGADTLDVPAGIGIWVAGGWNNVIEANMISGGHYGVAVTAFEAPALGNRVVGNTISGSSEADLTYDGLGAMNCFSGNGGSQGASSSDPPALQDTASCSSPFPVAPPNPVVPAKIGVWAVEAYLK